MAYYHRSWLALLRAGVAMVAEGFGMARPRTLLGAVCVMLATRAWSPYPDNDPVAAHRWMGRFYTLVIAHERADLDAAHAAELEVTWWRLHRERQYGVLDTDEPLVASLVDLYAYLYGAERDALRDAARLRVEAMAVSDAWVADGAPYEDRRVEEEHTLLLGSYVALRAVIGAA